MIICITCLNGYINKNIGIGNLSFRHTHFSDEVSGYCVEVKSWHDDDIGCEIHTPMVESF